MKVCKHWHDDFDINISNLILVDLCLSLTPSFPQVVAMGVGITTPLLHVGNWG